MSRSAESRALPVWIRLWVTFGATGLSPKAPGTMGSIAAAVLAWPLALADCPILFGVASALLFLISLPIVNRAVALSKTHDPGWIVIDEVCGQWLAFAFVAPALLLQHPWLIVLGLGFFRFFDILKPLGIKRLERLPGAWGIMADDMLGGAYAGILLWIIVRFAGL